MVRSRKIVMDVTYALVKVNKLVKLLNNIRCVKINFIILFAIKDNNLGEISSTENANYCQDAETGVTIADGKVWFDGCRQCLCQRGVQYCSLIACKMPSACPSQLFTSIKKSNTCCPMCPFSTNGYFSS